MSIVRGPINLIILTDPKEASETKNLKVEIKKQKVQGSSEEKEHCYKTTPDSVRVRAGSRGVKKKSLIDMVLDDRGGDISE